jgi:uncharacterized protein
MPRSDIPSRGATVVISHRVHPGMHPAYEEWLHEISPACRASEGFLELQVIRPLADISTSYTVVIGFDTTDHLRGWIESDHRRRLIDKAKPFLATDAYAIHSGLDFWFMPEASSAPVPVRWKQFLVTWSAIYPLALGVPLLVAPALSRLGVTRNALVAIPVTAIMVALMVYVIMPRYTKLVRRWLFA